MKSKLLTSMGIIVPHKPGCTLQRLRSIVKDSITKLHQANIINIKRYKKHSQHTQTQCLCITGRTLRTRLKKHQMTTTRLDQQTEYPSILLIGVATK